MCGHVRRCDDFLCASVGAEVEQTGSCEGDKPFVQDLLECQKCV